MTMTCIYETKPKGLVQPEASSMAVNEPIAYLVEILFVYTVLLIRSFDP